MLGKGKIYGFLLMENLPRLKGLQFQFILYNWRELEGD